MLGQETKRSFKTGPGKDVRLSKDEFLQIQSKGLSSEFFNHVGHESSGDHNYKVRSAVPALISFLTEEVGLQHET